MKIKACRLIVMDGAEDPFVSILRVKQPKKVNRVAIRRETSVNLYISKCIKFQKALIFIIIIT
jgi:hypothetical protein